MGVKVEWVKSNETPGELSEAQNGFSIDVLVYFESLEEHTIAWYDYNQMKWLFLSNQNYTKQKFKWRYFQDEIDK